MSDHQKDNILLVDDEENVTKSLRRLLSSLDVEVMTATNGAEALAILKETPVALIISDQRMPGMTGVEFLQQARRIRPTAMRILLTGYADIDATIEAINSGAVKYYLNKPWDDESLLSRVKESLALHRTICDNRRLNEKIVLQNAELVKLNQTLDQRVETQAGKITEQHEELTKSFMETIKALSAIIELRQKEVGSHSQRVATVVQRMLRGMKLSPKDYQDIIVAAFLHDIGKIKYSDALLGKNPDTYTKQDVDAVALHPILGQSCVQNISGFEGIGLIIRSHHENYNGTGYPDHLIGEKIPFGSRVIRIANEFDKLGFAAGHSSAQRLRDAVAELVREAGTVYDSNLVKRLVGIDLEAEFYHQALTDIQQLKVVSLRPGMTVAEDIYTASGMFLLPKGARLANGMISRLKKIDQHDAIRGGVRIYKQGKPKEGLNAPVHNSAR